MGKTAFVPEGTPRDEVPSIFENMSRENPSDEGGPRVLVQRYLCTKNVRADLDGVLHTAKKGEILEPTADLVRIAPDSFRPVSVDA